MGGLVVEYVCEYVNKDIACYFDICSPAAATTPGEQGMSG